MARHLVKLALCAALAFSVAPTLALAENADDELDKILEQGLKKIENAENKPSTPPAKEVEQAPKATKKPTQQEKKAQAPVEAPKKPVIVPALAPAPSPVGTPALAPAPEKKVSNVYGPAGLGTKATPAAATAEPIAPKEIQAAPVVDTPAKTSEPAAKEGTPTIEAKVEEKGKTSTKPEKAWHVALSLNTSLGVGTFVKNFYASNPSVTQLMTAEFGYSFALPADYKLNLSVRQFATWEFTKVDNNSGHYFDLYDTGLGLGTKLVTIPGAGIDVTTSLGVSLPISATSRHAGLIMGLSGSIGLKRAFKWEVRPNWHMGLIASYGFLAKKNFHKSIVTVQQNQDVPTGAGTKTPTLLTRADDPIVNGGLSAGYALTSHTISNSFNLTYSPHDIVALTFTYSIANGFKYPLVNKVDDLTSQFAKVGPGRFDEERGIIDLTVDVTDYLSLSAGIFTAQPPFAPDNKTRYFPFFNAASAANNYTSFYLAVGGTI